MRHFSGWYTWRLVQGLLLIGILTGFIAFMLFLQENVQSKGGDDMLEDKIVLMEVERAMNLVRGFGWVKVKEEIVGDDIFITVRKMFTPTPVDVTPGNP